jgi:glycosyltransferase involved in cell wall biosynthesis
MSAVNRREDDGGRALTMIQPFVSALMVTAARPERFSWFQASLDGYLRQTYSPREMVIVLDAAAPADRRRLESYLESVGRNDVRLVIPEGKACLGALRNRSLDAALGDVICLWDDDDLHHPQRIERQVALLQKSGAGAVLLADCLHLFMNDGFCYWVNWGRTRFRGLPGTLLARRDHGLRYPEEGRFSRAGEDTDFLERLATAMVTEYLAAPPLLYVYRFHGHNTWKREHHLMLARRFCEPQEKLLGMRSAVCELVGAVDFGLLEAKLAGSDGVAYTVHVDQPGAGALDVPTT